MQRKKLLRLVLPALLVVGLFSVLIAVRSGKIEVCGMGPATTVSRPALPLQTEKVDKSKTRILIEKSAYQLHLYAADSLLKSYPVVLGPAPEGDKYREGDGRTPEGFFKIKSMYDHQKWSKFIWIDYPNEESWRRFRKRQAEGMLPAGATIGGEIGIHGVPAGRDDIIADKINWTLGCISLTTGDIQELYAVVQEGTVIEIRP